MNELMTIKNVRGYMKDNTAYLNLEDVARGLGFTRIAESGNEVVRWERVDGYLRDLGVPTCGHDGFIPENIFYRLAMKAKNETAEKFQALVADEILPSIRKHGAYMTPETIEKVLLNPDTIIQLATALKEEKQRRLMLEPKAMAFDTFMDGSNLQTMNDVAKCLGIGRNKLFEFLRKKKIIRANNTPYQEYIDRGYFEAKEKPIKMGDASINYVQTFVTAKGVDYLRKVLEKEKAAINI